MLLSDIKKAKRIMVWVKLFRDGAAYLEVSYSSIEQAVAPYRIADEDIDLNNARRGEGKKNDTVFIG